MTNTIGDKEMVVNLMDVSIQGDCRPVTLQACYLNFDSILTAFKGKFLAKICLQMPSKYQNVKVTDL